MRKLIVKYLPFLGPLKRFFVALYQSLTNSNSFSQHQEDKFFLDYVITNNIKNDDWLYIDVGANHPTDISNSYLLYKHGFSGIIIEPNKELLRLFKWFRKRDTLLPIGCSDKASMLRFYVSKTPVISSFQSEWMDAEVLRSYFVPVMRLEDAVNQLVNKKILLLSVDVEGLNPEVLKGSKKLFNNTLFICIEFSDDLEFENYRLLIGEDFELIETKGCNAIYKNLSFESSLNFR